MQPLGREPLDLRSAWHIRHPTRWVVLAGGAALAAIWFSFSLFGNPTVAILWDVLVVALLACSSWTIVQFRRMRQPRR